MRLFILLSLLLLACTNDGRPAPGSGTPHPEAPVTGVVDPQPMPAPGCYRMVLRRDTAHLKLQVQGDSVTGQLLYDRFEKDGSFGTFRGRMHDSLLLAEYTFESEGMTSVRQVAFRLRGQILLEGYGPVDTRSDTVRFLRTDALEFLEGSPYVQVKCE